MSSFILVNIWQRDVTDSTFIHNVLWGVILTMCLWHVADQWMHLHTFTMNSSLQMFIQITHVVHVHSRSSDLALPSNIYNHTYQQCQSGVAGHNTVCFFGGNVAMFMSHSQNAITFSVIVFCLVSILLNICIDDWCGVDEEGVHTSLWSFISEVIRPNLHLCKFNWVFVALPVEPVDPLQKERISWYKGLQ